MDTSISHHHAQTQMAATRSFSSSRAPSILTKSSGGRRLTGANWFRAERIAAWMRPACPSRPSNYYLVEEMPVVEKFVVTRTFSFGRLSRALSLLISHVCHSSMHHVVIPSDTPVVGDHHILNSGYHQFKICRQSRFRPCFPVRPVVVFWLRVCHW